MAQTSKLFFIEDLNTTVEVTAYFEKINYGYDADGRRGEWRWELQKTQWTVPDQKDNSERLTATEKLECELELQKLVNNFYDWKLDYD